MYWHAEGMKSAFSGTVTLNGKQYSVTPETCYGYADKNWGRDFTSPWVWLDVRTKFSFREDDEKVYWHVVQENVHAVMDTMIICEKKDMLFVNYEAPDGSRKHNRLFNGGNGYGVVKLFERTRDGLYLLDEIEATHVGCEYGEYDEE